MSGSKDRVHRMAYGAEWYAKNREAARAYAKAYYWKNHAKLRAEARARMAAKRTADPIAASARNRRAITGWTHEQYETALEAQRGRCAVCGVDAGRKLNADHDHTTGQPRALLCRDCNLGIGKLGDSLDRLRAAVAYLERYR